MLDCYDAMGRKLLSLGVDDVVGYSCEESDEELFAAVSSQLRRRRGAYAVAPRSVAEEGRSSPPRSRRDRQHATNEVAEPARRPASTAQ
jgi:hypothetical protein